MSISLDSIALYAFAGILVFLVLWIVRLEWRLKNMLRGKHAHDLEDVLIDMGRSIDELSAKHSDIHSFSQNMNERLKKSLQKIHTLRFNPFRDQGGNQSFATCLLDEEGNGVVISSLYSRDKVGIYAKPIVGGKSEFELSEEELEVIKKASE